MLRILLILLLMIVAIPILFAIWLILTYNSMVRKKQLVKEAWSGIDVQLKRRADLVPNLVNTVKAFAKHEKDIIQKVLKAREDAIKAKEQRSKLEAESKLGSAIRQLIVLADRYPELRSNRNFLHLQKVLHEIEDELQLARRYYNATVREYNSLIQSFPAILIARALGFRKESYFDLDTTSFLEGKLAEEQRKPPQIEF